MIKAAETAIVCKGFEFTENEIYITCNRGSANIHGLSSEKRLSPNIMDLNDFMFAFLVINIADISAHVFCGQGILV